MGFNLRKSIQVGPFRFNLSKSGMGVSAGVKGLRIGSSPRGNYIHMGIKGLKYRATLPSSHKINNQPKTPNPPVSSLETHAPLEEIESADISEIVDSSSRELLDELNTKRKKIRLWPIVTIISIVAISIAISANWPNWLLYLLVFIGLAGIYTAYARDTLAKTVVLFYDFDSEMEAAYTKLHYAASQLADCSAAWHIEASGKVHDQKYHAGASSLVRRNKTTIRKSEPPYVKTNIETISIGVGRQTLHFFPDRIFIYDHNGVGSVSYNELNINVTPSQFIESESVPRDAEIIDRTWEYVNKSGGPDKRFKDNKELPICLYEEIKLSSQSGLNEIVQLSRSGLGLKFSEAISLLSTKIPR